MDNAPDLWEDQIARLLRSYREPAVPEARLREIGEDIARRLAETGAVEANLNAVLPFYKEPEIDADRLARIGRELADQLQLGLSEPGGRVEGQPAAETPRKLRPVRRHRPTAPPNRAPLVWGLATAAAVFLLVLLANVFSGNPPPRPNRQEAKIQPIEEPRQLQPAPAPPEEKPKPPVVPDQPKPPEEKPKEPPPAPPPPAPLPTPRPVPPEPPKETPKPVAPTLTAPARTEVARLERVQGEVFIVGAAAKIPAKAGDPILPGSGLQTGRDGAALVRYADTTSVELGAETTVSRFDEGDKRVGVAAGLVTSQITRQPAGRPMIFTTPHAEAKVVGTKLTLWVRPDWTRLEVKEGRVRFTRTADGSAADVGVDQYAVATAGPKPIVRKVLPSTLKGIHLLEDFEDPLGVETRWQPLEGGAPRSTLGTLELDLSPRPNESYAAGGWHAAWGMRTRQHFPLPLRISLDVEHTEKHVDANLLVVLVPRDRVAGVLTNEIAVHLRDAQYGILVGGQPVKTVDRNWTPPLRERWTVELDRRDVRFFADGKQVLRHAHGLQVPAEYRLELHGGAKMTTPAGARIRYDNVRIEP